MLVVLLIAVLVIAAVVCAATILLQQKSFNGRFPPITDAEFLARCTPGTSPEIALNVRRIIAKELGIECERVHPSLRFIDAID